MERIKQSVTFDICTAETWPDGARPTCVAKGPDRNGLATIVKHPDCPESDLAAMKAGLESDWQEHLQDLRDELLGSQAEIGATYTD